MLRRRDFCKGATSLAALNLSRLAGSGAFAISALVNTEVEAAFDPVSAALAAAAWLAQQIANKNKDDGGLNALNRENQKLLIEALDKLNDIRDLVSQVLDELEKLPDILEKALDAHDAKVLQNQLRGTIEGYQRLLRDNGGGRSIEAWRKDTNTQRGLSDLLTQLRAARDQLKANYPIAYYGPTGALLAGPVGLVEHSLLNQTNTWPYDIVKTIVQEDINWLKSTTDPAIEELAASYTAAAVVHLKQLESEARALHLGDALEALATGQSKGPVHTACVGINAKGYYPRLVQTATLTEYEFVYDDKKTETPTGLKFLKIDRADPIPYEDNKITPGQTRGPDGLILPTGGACETPQKTVPL